MSETGEKPPLIEFRQLRKAFGEKVVLDGLDLSIRQGAATVLIGKSGEGKSVLLKHMIGLMNPTGGEIFFKGEPVEDLKRRERRALLGRVSYLFQHNALLDSLTVFDNVALPLAEGARLEKPAIRARVRDKLQQLDLGNIGRLYPPSLSGGMQRRVALARALVNEPELLLFDEPTTGLDPIRKREVLKLIAEYRMKFGFTAVIVSHDIPEVFYIASHVAVLDEGKIVYAGPPEGLAGSGHPAVRELCSGPEMLQKDLQALTEK